MEQTGRPAQFDPKARTVVVIAGAAARGAYEAGALARVLPALFGNDLSNVVLLGTSAGAINAALWGARLAGNVTSQDVGEQVKGVWEGITQRSVFVTSSAAFALGKLFVRGLWSFVVECDCDWLATYRLLNTDPLKDTAQSALDVTALKRNIDEGRLLGVGAVATSCPNDGSGGRSRVFLYGQPALMQTRGLAQSPAGSSIDYVPLADGLKHEHVLASAAIPAAFPPVHINEPAEYAGWYTDGGVRLNTPIRPAIDMDASQLIVISSLATEYPEPRTKDRQPHILDVSAQAIHTVLGDGTIEDLRSLQRVNDMVLQAQGGGVTLKASEDRDYKVISFLAISPENGQLSALADEQLENARRSSLDYRALSAVLSSAGPRDGGNELAGYLLFYPPYSRAQFDLAASDVDRKGALQDAFTM
ncbi:MAG TPA: patatin-like phospholipase family protein [Polyangiales bacterium]|nr:patatin-like phospholipase family protein [Polyangiales bacterium]